MLRVLLVVACSAVVFGDNKKCLKLAQVESQDCCERDIPIMSLQSDIELAECYQLPGDGLNCEQDLCIAKKKGYATFNGKIMKLGLQEFYESTFGEDPQLYDLLKTKCIDGDISKFGTKDTCDATKQNQCMFSQLSLSCPKWHNKGSCAGLKELLEECKSKHPDLI